MDVSTGLVLEAMSAGALGILAVGLFVLDPRGRVTRAFAMLLALRAVSIMAHWMGSLGPLETARFWSGVSPYFVIPLAPAAFYFALVYPRARRFPGSRWAPAGLLFVTLAFEAAYFLDHSLFWDIAASPTGRWTDAPLGPLSFLNAAWLLAYAIVAVVFARDWLRAPEGPHRRSIGLVSGAFAVFAASSAVAGFAGEAARASPLVGMTYILWPTVALCVLLAAALARVALAGPPERRPGARVFLGFLAAAVGSAALLFFAGSSLPYHVVYNFWRLALPVVVVYAILRHQIFDIDVRVRWTISRGAVAAVFLAAFFIVTAVAENLLDQSQNWVFGGIATGVLLFAIHPIQRLGERLANAALPQARPGRAEGGAEALYRSNLEFAWSDGALSPDERMMLNHLRDRLALPLDVVARIEDEVAKEAASRPATGRQR